MMILWSLLEQSWDMLNHTHHFLLAFYDCQISSFGLTVVSAQLPGFLAQRSVVAIVLKLLPARETLLICDCKIFIIKQWQTPHKQSVGCFSALGSLNLLAYQANMDYNYWQLRANILERQLIHKKSGFQLCQALCFVIKNKPSTYPW